MSIEELQKKHEEYDQDYWNHKHGSDMEKIRHITLHLGKTLGKLSAYCEKKEHGEDFSTQQIENEVIPDLLFHSLQLSNLLKLDLEEKYLERLDKNIEKINSKK